MKWIKKQMIEGVFKGTFFMFNGYVSNHVFRKEI